MSVVELKSVSKSYCSVVAVDDVDLVVETGEFVTLLGPSGCGKTTTLRMIAGFARPSSGSIVIGDRDVTRVPPHRREVGLVFQNYALFPHMTVHGNVEFGLRMRRVAAAERRRRVAEALELVRLEGLAERLPSQLSGGQQQRVALARALVIRPKVLLLDEPFGALDKQLRDHMRVELRDLQRTLAISTVFVTHDQEEAMSMSDRICVMASGALQQVGPPDEIYQRPRNRFVADFMGHSNLLEGKIDSLGSGSAVLDLQGTRLNAYGEGYAAGDPVLAMIRPERIRLGPADAAGATTSARLDNAVYLGATTHFQLTLPSGQALLATSQNEGQEASTPLVVGQTVSVTIPDDAVYLIRGHCQSNLA